MITVNQLPIGQQYLCESSNSYAKTAKISFLFWYRIRAEVRKNGLKGAIALLSLYLISPSGQHIIPRSVYKKSLASMIYIVSP